MSELAAQSSPAPGTTHRQINLVSRPRGLPRDSDFEIVEVPTPEPGEGEVLVRNRWMSLDPSLRIRMHESESDYLPAFKLGQPIESWAVGEIITSRAEGFAPGDHVLHPLGWREIALLSLASGPGRRGPEKIEVSAEVPARLYLGPLSWVGLTSYVGLLDVAELRDGDVVFISAAAGAVGNLAVQIAKLRGHRVIGSAGSAAKLDYLRELGCDAVFNYREGAIGDQLRDAAPDGIDVYFDNVGGDHLQAALDCLRPFGRVALCGAISTYNAAQPVPGPSNLFQAVAKGLTLRGFLSRMYADRMPDFRRDMRRWLAEGTIKYPEHTFSGLDSAPAGLRALLEGQNIGKVLVALD